MQRWYNFNENSVIYHWCHTAYKNSVINTTKLILSNLNYKNISISIYCRHNYFVTNRKHANEMKTQRYSPFCY